MGKRKKAPGAVQWYLPGKKRPFAYSTIADSDVVALLAEQRHTPTSALRADLLLPPEVRVILQAYIDAGYGLVTLEELGVR